MINVDHLRTRLTVAERPARRHSGDPAAPVAVTQDYSTTKLVRDLAPGDVIELNYRGWGNHVMEVLYKSWTAADDNTVRLELRGSGPGDYSIDFRDADEQVVLAPANLVGAWR
jgi:hypothetical protein